MTYKIDDYWTYETAEEAAEHISHNIETDSYDEMLDDCYEEIKIGNLSYFVSQVLRSVDPIAYKCGFNDYVDSIYQDILYDLERMSDGETQDFYGSSVECIEEEDNDD